jgi:DNA-binding response OmpR family regulator
MILDKRKELPTKYKKLLESSGENVICVESIENALDILTKYEPDLIMISDSINTGLPEAVKKIRFISYPARPCIVALSKSSDLEDKLATLNAGADDFLSEPIDSEEFKARINAHLRRHFENVIDDKTQLVDMKSSLRVLKRTLIESEKNKWAAMLLKINNFEAYKELYGELAADKMMQTYVAIISSALDKSDFIGGLSDGEFLVLTSALKVEHVASFLVYAFDAIVDKFYNEEDSKQGYIILKGDDDAGKRVGLVSTSIGVISSEFQKYESVNSAMSALLTTTKLASLNPNSSYVVERAKISAKNSILNKEYNNKILIIEPDEALNYLLKTTAEMQGYEVSSIMDYESTFVMMKSLNPALVILDAGNLPDLKGLDLCCKLKKDNLYRNTKVILSTIVHDKKMVLNTGADLYLPKPYELLGIFNWVEFLIKEYNS